MKGPSLLLFGFVLPLRDGFAWPKVLLLLLSTLHRRRSAFLDASALWHCLSLFLFLSFLFLFSQSFAAKIGSDNHLKLCELVPT